MRKAEIGRRTKETDIQVRLEIDGNGRSEIDCQDQFLSHMLDTLARYASFDLAVRARGDNEHHLVEDVAIVLGKALREAMAGTPVSRMGWAVVPMDDALVTVSLDMIERPYADIECPLPIYQHFLRSFCMSSGITLHTAVMRGFDEHHIVEATFKALGLSLKMALMPREDILSTKEEEIVERR